MERRMLSVTMTRRQIIAGLIFLPFYLILLSLGLELLLRAVLPEEPTAAQLNACFYAVTTAAILLIFGGFLRRDLNRADWRRVFRGLPLALLAYYGISVAVNSVVLLLQPDFANQNNNAILGIMETSPVFVVILSVILAPLIEESIFRGLIFGNLLRFGRFAAYAVTALGFAAIHVVGYLGILSALEIVLSILQYIPAAVVLCAVYEKHDTIAASMLLHASINLISCLIMGAM